MEKTSQPEELVTNQSNEQVNATEIPKKPRFPRIYILLGLFVLVILLLAGYWLAARKQVSLNTHSPTPSNQATQTNPAWKTYTNSYYNFKLDIPSDWKTEENTIKGQKTIYNNDDFQVYKLSSPNGDIVIENTPNNKNNHIKQQLPNSKVQLGEYSVDRYPYINDNGERIDGIYLDNIKRQKLIVFNLTINGDFENNNGLLLKILKSFEFVKQDPSLDDEVLYTIPSGWKKEDTDVSRGLSFVSNDFHEEGLPTIVTGARITINKTRKDPTKTLAQQTTPDNIYGTWNIATRSATFNSIPFTNVFACAGEFGFCRDYYSAEDKSGNVWTMAMICNKDCNTKAGIDSTVYAKDRDAFLKSIRFTH